VFWWRRALLYHPPGAQNLNRNISSVHTFKIIYFATFFRSRDKIRRESGRLESKAAKGLSTGDSPRRLIIRGLPRRWK
jgi:hypothetical protein